MKIYLAGSSKQRGFLVKLARLIEQQGHTITHKWWEHFAYWWTGDEEGPDFYEAAKADLQGVRDANALIVVMDHDFVSPGAHFEMGFAFALGLPILVLVSDLEKCRRTNIWLQLDEVYVCPMGDLGADMSGLNDQLHFAGRVAA